MIVDLVKFIRKSQEITLHTGSDLKDLCVKDAIYKAAGLSAFNLFDEVSVRAWEAQVESQLKQIQFTD